MNQKILLTICLASVFLISQLLRLFPDGKLHLYFCDVGQGDGIYLRTPKGTDILIDGGPDEKILQCLSDKMLPFDNRIEIIFLTHKQSDHLTGLLAVLEKYQVGELIDSADNHENKLTQIWEKSIKTSGIKRTVVVDDQAVVIKDGVVLDLLWPPQDYFPTEPNGFSTNIKLSFNLFTGLFTGDLGSNEQNILLNKKRQQIADLTVLKISHHGSNKDLHKEFIQVISPDISVISVGKNSYGHPGKDVLQFLKSLSVKVFRTDQNGTIEVETDGKTYRVETEK
ncbi:MBL fold metallo-hydrolase [Candidatus Microgenomates bacterium]|nr:MBL fold metallo-hydrolase [Candidatus Microgenomates bacterium]